MKKCQPGDKGCFISRGEKYMITRGYNEIRNDIELVTWDASSAEVNSNLTEGNI